MIQKGFIIGLAVLLSIYLGCGDDDNGSEGSGETAENENGTSGTDSEVTDAGEEVAETKNDAGTSGTGGGGTDTGEDADTARDHPRVEAGGQLLSECPQGTECMSPMGNFWCGSLETHLPPRCKTDDECDFGVCFSDGGHGWCLQLCEPPGGFPEQVTITGKVVEKYPFAEYEFTGAKYLTENQPPIEGVRVCVHEHSEIPCVNSGADGVFKLQGVPYNLMDIFLSVTKDGYQSCLWFLEGGTQRDRALPGVVTLYTDEQLEQLATALGADYPEETTGAIVPVAMKPKTEGENSPFTFSWDIGDGDLVPVEGFTVVLEPQSGIGPVYVDAEGDLDSSLNASSIAGQAYFFNLEPGDYTLQYIHPDLFCGEPISVTIVPGFTIAALGNACFPPLEE